MARGVTLSQLLYDYRAECRVSTSAALSRQVEETQKLALKRKQEWFWEDFAWPHLRVERFINLAEGQRYYDPMSATKEDGTGGADLDISRIIRVDVRYSGVYSPVGPTIGDEHYAAHDSERDQRAWPARRWMITEDNMIEIWPIPDQSADTVTLEGRLRLIGIRKLRPLVEDTDTCDVDANLIVKSAAADYLAASGAKDGQLKLDQAARLYAKLKGQLAPKKATRLFLPEEQRPSRPVIQHYKPPGT